MVREEAIAAGMGMHEIQHSMKRQNPGLFTALTGMEVAGGKCLGDNMKKRHQLDC
ncbi:MAG: hypothetical protein MJY81_01755 [Bacteroidaceae bacterium]|nr:hypothetical protein [Bacteroidaceae bacterium]